MGADLPRLLVEAFIADMDDSLREMGTGDLTVPKKVRRRRHRALRAQRGLQTALAAGDPEALVAVFAEHVYVDADARLALRLAAYVQATAAGLAATDAGAGRR